MYLITGLQLVIAVGLMNVWLIRARRATSYRGSEAKTLYEEFQVYGLPAWFFYLIGFLKLGAAAALLLGLFWSFLILPAAVLVVSLMLGAVAMHIKVKDEAIKFLPASLMLVLSLTLVATAF